MQQALASSAANAATSNETTSLLPQHHNHDHNEQGAGDSSVQDPHSYSAASEEYMTDDDEWQDDEDEDEAAANRSFLGKAWNGIKGAFIIIANVESKLLWFSHPTVSRCDESSSFSHSTSHHIVRPLGLPARPESARITSFDSS